MRKVSSLVRTFGFPAVISCLLLVCAGRAEAANNGTIGISNLSSTQAGKITADGTYTVKDGWSVTSITLIAYPSNGGAQSSQAAGYMGGNWGPASITGLTSGVKYNVYAQMMITDGTVSQTINSAISTITVQ